ncbi:MAG: YkgJ family cysteine cluster protein [Crocinitomicaceae bacterium]
MDVEKELKRGEQDQKKNRKLVKTLKKTKPKGLDACVQELHDSTFDEIDCLSCANCCKTTSPGMHERDIDRLSGFLKIKPSELIERYMEMDTDGEYVFRSAPCPFLGEDHYCSVYEARPLACRGYPHTNRKKFYQLLDISLKNTAVCPAVIRIFDGLREQFEN